MDIQDGASSPADQVLTNHHRRCAIALARLRLLVSGDGNAIGHGDAVRDVEQAIRQVLDEVAAAEQHVLTILAGTYQVRPAARLLGCRLVRLTDAAQHVSVALRAGDVSWLRRNLARFDALAQEACAVQLDVFTSAPAARHPHPRKPTAARPGAMRG